MPELLSRNPMSLAEMEGVAERKRREEEAAAAAARTVAGLGAAGSGGVQKPPGGEATPSAVALKPGSKAGPGQPAVGGPRVATSAAAPKPALGGVTGATTPVNLTNSAIPGPKPKVDGEQKPYSSGAYRRGGFYLTPGNGEEGGQALQRTSPPMGGQSKPKRRTLEDVEREIRDVEGRSAWHHKQFQERMTTAPREQWERDPFIQQHVRYVQRVLNPRLIALKRERDELMQELRAAPTGSRGHGRNGDPAQGPVGSKPKAGQSTGPFPAVRREHGPLPMSSKPPVGSGAPTRLPAQPPPSPYANVGRLFAVERRVLTQPEQRGLNARRAGKPLSVEQQRQADRAQEKLAASYGQPFTPHELRRREQFGPGSINPRTLDDAAPLQGWNRFGEALYDMNTPNAMGWRRKGYESYRDRVASGVLKDAAPPSWSSVPAFRSLQEADLKRIRIWAQQIANAPIPGAGDLEAVGADYDLFDRTRIRNLDLSRQAARASDDAANVFGEVRRAFRWRMKWLATPEAARELGVTTNFGRQLLKAISAERLEWLKFAKQEAEAWEGDKSVALGSAMLGRGARAGATAYVSSRGAPLARWLGPLARETPEIVGSIVEGGTQQAGTAFVGGERDPVELTKQFGTGAATGAVTDFLLDRVTATALAPLQRWQAQRALEGEVTRLADALRNQQALSKEGQATARELSRMQRKLAELKGVGDVSIPRQPVVSGSEVAAPRGTSRQAANPGLALSVKQGPGGIQSKAPITPQPSPAKTTPEFRAGKVRANSPSAAHVVSEPSVLPTPEAVAAAQTARPNATRPNPGSDPTPAARSEPATKPPEPDGSPPPDRAAPPQGRSSVPEGGGKKPSPSAVSDPDLANVAPSADAVPRANSAAKTQVSEPRPVQVGDRVEAQRRGGPVTGKVTRVTPTHIEIAPEVRPEGAPGRVRVSVKLAQRLAETEAGGAPLPPSGT
ncbi:MAG: hypothetical protein ACO1SX_20105, partial [Actinomycetota bacterium]